MKNLKDYIQEECDGCATPGNTLGMGNPMAPGAPGSPGFPGTPGTEPIGTIKGVAGPAQEKKETSKRKKKKVTESILDDEATLSKNANVNAIKNWLDKNSPNKEGTYQIDPDTLEIHSSYLSIAIAKEWPNFIKLGDVKVLRLLSENCKKLVIPVPNKCQKITIDTDQTCKKLVFDGEFDNPRSGEVRVFGYMDEIEFTKPFISFRLDISDCRELLKIKGSTNIRVEDLNLPGKFCSELIKSSLRPKDVKYISLRGNLLN